MAVFPGRLSRGVARLERRVAFYPLGAAMAPLLEETRSDWKRAYAALGRCLTQLFEERFHQILPLHHLMPEFVPLCPGHFSLQCRQVVGQQVTQQDGLRIRKD